MMGFFSVSLVNHSIQKWPQYSPVGSASSVCRWTSQLCSRLCFLINHVSFGQPHHSVCWVLLLIVIQNLQGSLVYTAITPGSPLWHLGRGTCVPVNMPACIRVCGWNHHIYCNVVFIMFYFITFVSSLQPVMSFLDPHSVIHRLGSHSSLPWF